MRRVLAVLAAAVLCAGVVFPQVSAQAVTPTSTSVNTTTATIKTSAGIFVHVQLNAFRGSSTGPDYLTVSVSRNSSAGSEMHSWSFKLTTTSISYNSSTGKGTVTTATKQLGSFGLIKLTLTRTASARHVACTSGSETRTPISVKGILHFVPGGTWGSFGSSTASFTFPAGSNVLVDTGCTRPSSTPICYTATTWSSQSLSVRTRTGTVIGSQSVSGAKNFVAGRAVGSVAGIRNVSLSSPAHATRFDFLTAPAPVPVGPTATSPYTLSATTKSGTLATGSAKVKDTAAPVTFNLGTCKKGTATGTQKVKSYPKPLYSTPSTKKLTLHSSMGGNIAVPSGSGTNYGGLTVFSHT
jgi:hypothetical protein